MIDRFVVLPARSQNLGHSFWEHLIRPDGKDGEVLVGTASTPRPIKGERSRAESSPAVEKNMTKANERL